MNTAIDQLFNLPSDKVEGDVFAEMLKKEIPTAYTKLTYLVQLKVLEKVIKEVLTDDSLDVAFLEEFKQFSKDNKLTVNRATLTSQEYGAKYNFSSDPAWLTIDNQIKDLTEHKKKIEEVLKSDKIKTAGKVKVNVKL
jgi:hypothetical protein